MKSWKAIAGICLIFILGIVAGGLTTGIVIRHRIQKFVRGGPQAVSEIVLKKLDRSLRLDPAQQEKTRKIVLAAQDKIVAARLQIQPEVREAMQTARGDIQALLTPEQTKKFDELLLKRTELTGRLK